VLPAMLDEARFRGIHGPGWILADGRSVSGSRYHEISGSANAPDLRGIALRGKNNGRSDGNQDPDGERALGNFQSHAFGSHTHVQNQHRHTYIDETNLTTAVFNTAGGTGMDNKTSVGKNTGWETGSNQNAGSNETRMRNVAVNYFIKVN
jgi:hypothetical protein